MNSLPSNLKKSIDFFERLPSIGSKTARRLAFYLLRLPQNDLEEFAKNLINLKKNSLFCKTCFNLTESEICSICDDMDRDKSVITVVEDVLDLLSMEQGDQYHGLYHVLHGRIDPLNNIGPDEIYIPQLLSRLKKSHNETSEIILATNPNTEGEATAMYIKKQIDNIGNFKITRLAYGLPIGADIEYADYMTLKKAMDGRKEF